MKKTISFYIPFFKSINRYPCRNKKRHWRVVTGVSQRLREPERNDRWRVQNGGEKYVHSREITSTSSSSVTNPMALNQSLQQVPNIYSDMVRSYLNYLAGFSRYSSDFYQSFLISTLYFNQVESKNVLSASPLESLEKTHFQLSLYNSWSVQPYPVAGLENNHGLRHIWNAAVSPGIAEGLLRLRCPSTTLFEIG